MVRGAEMNLQLRILGAVLVASVFGVAVAAQADPFPIRIGWVQTPGHMAPVIEALGKKHPGIFKHLGQSYAFDPIHFAGTTPQIQAQAIGELDIASQAPSALALAITNAHLDLRIVADVLQDGHDGYFSEDFVVKADGPVKTIDDVKGKRIATNTIGSASDSAMRAMFRKHGIQDADFTTVETNFANMRAMRADTIAAHRAALVDFFEDHIRAVRWFLDPANHKEAIAICADVTKLPEENLEYAFTKADFYHSPDAVPDIGLVQQEIDEDVELKVLPKPVKVDPKYVDLSLIGEAKKRLDGH